MKPYLTTTTLMPVRTSLATMEGSLPMRWPRPSTTIALGDIPGIFRNKTRMTLNKVWKFIFPLESNNPVRILFPEVIQILCEFILEMGLSILLTIPFPTSLTCSNFVSVPSPRSSSPLFGPSTTSVNHWEDGLYWGLQLTKRFNWNDCQ